MKTRAGLQPVPTQHSAKYTGPLILLCRSHHMPRRIASQYYVSYRTISSFNEHLKPTMGEIELLRLFALADEFKYMIVREARLGGEAPMRPRVSTAVWDLRAPVCHSAPGLHPKGGQPYCKYWRPLMLGVQWTKLIAVLLIAMRAGVAPPPSCRRRSLSWPS